MMFLGSWVWAVRASGGLRLFLGNLIVKVIMVGPTMPTLDVDRKRR